MVKDYIIKKETAIAYKAVCKLCPRVIYATSRGQVTQNIKAHVRTHRSEE